VCPLRRRAWIGTAAAAAFATLAGLVAAGSLTGLDQWAVRHAMPGAHGGGASPTTVESIVPLLHAEFGTPLLVAAQVVTLPGQLAVSSLLVGVGCLALVRRGRTDAAAAWGAAWLLATAIEVVCKETLERPALYRDGIRVVGFDTSWPSGHAVRAAVVAATLAAVWPRLRAPLVLWIVVVAGLLVAGEFHTPTDVLGGLLLATLLVSAAPAVERSGVLGRRAATGGATASRARAAPGGR
jgi:membrane-associated phospholipid phosphatase